MRTEYGADVPWDIPDDQLIAVHPTQIYEFLLGVIVLVSLIVADRMAGKENRPIGLITGLFALIYFGGRFFIEFTKEYQGIDEGWRKTRSWAESLEQAPRVITDPMASELAVSLPHAPHVFESEAEAHAFLSARSADGK